MSAVEEIRELLQSQLEAIDREVVALRATLETLEPDASVRATDTRRPDKALAAVNPKRPRKRSATTRPRTAEVVPLGKLEQLLGSTSEGLSAAALAKRTNGSPDQIRALLKDLEAAGKVRRTGQRRGTRWRVITDEDWIAERAAELELRAASRTTQRKAA
jgi:DNA-binding transcriptional ArsR family regulator